MHPNPVFRNTETEISLAFVRARGFGTLAVSADGAPLMAHVPFLLSQDASSLRMHLVRSNPICRAARDPVAARLDVLGPDGYISPDWYESPDQVPTWNYVAVSFTGRLEPLPPEALEPMLADQSAAYEGMLPKTPWTMDKMTEDTKARFLRMILPFRFLVDDMQSTWKLGQNKPDAARLAAARQVAGGLGHERTALAALMAEPPRMEQG